jgi:hypothetical protein
VKALGFRFPVAIDDDWSTLRRLWLNRIPEAQFTSASLLMDRQGIVRYVQSGGLYAKDASDPQARQDYWDLERTIRRLLAAP